MVLRKFFGKTLEAVKKSARQMYGDDFIILDSQPAEGNGQVGITVMAGSGARPGGAGMAGRGPDTTGEQAGKEDAQGGAFGERTGLGRNLPPASGSRTGMFRTRYQGAHPSLVRNGRARLAAPARGSEESPEKRVNGREKEHTGTPFTPGGSTYRRNHLKALREYAEKQDQAMQQPEVDGRSSGSVTKSPLETYSRADVRNLRSDQNTPNDRRDEIKKGARPDENKVEMRPDEKKAGMPRGAIKTGRQDRNMRPEDDGRDTSPPESISQNTIRNGSEHSLQTNGISRNLRPFGSQTDPVVSAIRREQQEVAALHRRFDKLEALLGSTLITSNFEYVSHPVFQQLVQTGISTSSVARWFGTIIKQGVDPYDQPETFMVRLSAIIRDAIDRPASGDPQKYLLFTGPAGAGKTTLIMKLLLHEEFMAGKKTGVISLMPQGEQSGPYYTIMEPFCKDRKIPWFPVRSGKDVTSRLEEWESYDHLLIDTPSIRIEEEDSFRQYWKLRQLVTPLVPLEVHYVVNATLGRFFFQQPLASHHPLLPDYVAITHLDEVSQWGPLLPFLEQMGCPARYTSTSESIPFGVRTFNPSWFAQQVLDDHS